MKAFESKVSTRVSTPVQKIKITNTEILNSVDQHNMENYLKFENLEKDFAVMWDDVIGEPEGLRSIRCAWNCSYKCFRGTRNCCYILLTTLFGPCLAFCSAINFACLAFQHIWCLGPCLRTWKINCAFIRNCLTVGTVACCGPCADTCGLYFSRVKVRYQRVPDGDDEKDIMIV